MYSYCILDSVANLLVRHMVFIVSYSILSQELVSLSRVLLSRPKVDKLASASA